MTEQTEMKQGLGNLAMAMAAKLWRRVIAWVREHRMQSGIIGGMLLVLLIVMGVVSAVGEDEAKATPPVKRAVEGLVLRPQDNVVDSFEITGTVNANVVVRMSAEVAGRVDRYAGAEDRIVNGEYIEGSAPPLDEGAVVQAGQPIVLINKDKLQPLRDRARAHFEYLTKELERMENSFEAGVATPLEVDQTLMQYRQAKADLALAEADLERACIRAEISGVLNDLPVEIGEYVQVGQIVVELVDMDPAKVIVAVPEKDIGYFRTGETQRITYGENGEQVTEGEITLIEELADPQTHTTHVELTVANPVVDGNRRFRDGDIVRVQMVRRVLRDELMIPLRAVIPLEYGHACYVAVDGKAERRWVNVAIQQTDQARVIPLTDRQRARAEAAGETIGLVAGEVLILQPARVGPGQAVTIVDMQGNPGPMDPDAPASQPASQPAEGQE